MVEGKSPVDLLLSLVHCLFHRYVGTDRNACGRCPHTIPTTNASARCRIRDNGRFRMLSSSVPFVEAPVDRKPAREGAVPLNSPAPRTGRRPKPTPHTTQTGLAGLTSSSPNTCLSIPRTAVLFDSRPRSSRTGRTIRPKARRLHPKEPQGDWSFLRVAKALPIHALDAPHLQRFPRPREARWHRHRLLLSPSEP